MSRRIRIVKRPAIVRETTGDRMLRLRTAKGWSQMRLATEAGVGQAGVSLIERNGQFTRIETMEALADALGVTLQYLWSGAVQCKHDDAAEAV